MEPVDSRADSPEVVDSDWLETSFNSRVCLALDQQSAGKGGVVWIAADSAGEGDYLVTQVGRMASREGHILAQSKTVSPYDPLLFWNDMLGDSDEEGWLSKEAPGSVVLIRDAHLLPPGFFWTRGNMIESLCQAVGCLIVMSLYRSAAETLPPQISVISPPKFVLEADEGRLPGSV